MTDDDTKTETCNPKLSKEEKETEQQSAREVTRRAIDKTEKLIGECLDALDECPRALMEYTSHMLAQLNKFRDNLSQHPQFTRDLAKCLLGLECSASNEELEKHLATMVGKNKASVAITSEGQIINLPEELKKRLVDIRQRMDEVNNHEEIEKMTEAEITMRKALELLMALQEKGDVGKDELN